MEFKSAGIIPYNSDGCYYLIQDKKGRWSDFGGKREANESAATALETPKRRAQPAAEHKRLVVEVEGASSGTHETTPRDVAAAAAAAVAAAQQQAAKTAAAVAAVTAATAAPMGGEASSDLPSAARVMRPGAAKRMQRRAEWLGCARYSNASSAGKRQARVADAETRSGDRSGEAAAAAEVEMGGEDVMEAVQEPVVEIEEATPRRRTAAAASEKGVKKMAERKKQLMEEATRGLRMVNAVRREWQHDGP